MDFDLTEEQRLVRDTAREFALREIAPKAAEIDRTGAWPTEIVQKMGELGFMGVAIPTEHGGNQARRVETVGDAAAERGLRSEMLGEVDGVAVTCQLGETDDIRGRHGLGHALDAAQGQVFEIEVLQLEKHGRASLSFFGRGL